MYNIARYKLSCSLANYQESFFMIVLKSDTLILLRIEDEVGTEIPPRFFLVIYTAKDYLKRVVLLKSNTVFKTSFNQEHPLWQVSNP